MNDAPRPSLREAARRGVEANRREREAKTPPPKPGKPSVVGVEQVTASCGHAVPFELLENKKDKFRDARRQNLAARPCPACRKAAHEQLTASQQQEARRRGDPCRRRTARLPNGSAFSVKYAGDAKGGLWSGTLTVPTECDGPAEFRGEASAVYTLLSKLDCLYRASLHPARSTL